MILLTARRRKERRGRFQIEFSEEIEYLGVFHMYLLLIS